MRKKVSIMMSIWLVLGLLLSLSYSVKTVMPLTDKKQTAYQEMDQFVRWEQGMTPVIRNEIKQGTRSEVIGSWQNVWQSGLLESNRLSRLSLWAGGSLISLLVKIIEYIHNKDGPKSEKTPI